MTYIDFYLVIPNGSAPDYEAALAGVRGDEDAEEYMGELVSVLRDGVLDPDNLTERVTDGETIRWVFQDHNGVGDGGSLNIGNTKWIATSYPQAYAALGVTISWGRGTSALLGSPTHTY